MRKDATGARTGFSGDELPILQPDVGDVPGDHYLIIEDLEGERADGVSSIHPAAAGFASIAQAVMATVEPSTMSRSIGHEPRVMPAVGAA